MYVSAITLANKHTHTHTQINAAAEVIYEAVDPNANIIFGALVDESMNGEIAITVIATGFPVMSTADALTGKRMVTGAGLMRK
jgi:cell division protein FtsZ